ncbi:MAG: 50S ribosomal protein L9 [Candidatus Obscuribacterales bacterium]|nr:50S ribosomal protein L9 [Candidatus Obscuribacterales bacterium]
MKIILQQNVAKLGKAGDVVESSDGYFRNFLQPRNLAVVASTGTLKKREEDLTALKKKAEVAHQADQDLAEKIKAHGTVKLTAKAGEGGKLYGKITNKEIAQQLAKDLSIEVDKRAVKAADDITFLGSYPATVKLSPEVTADIMVEVVAE